MESFSEIHGSSVISKIPGADAFCVALVMLLLCVPILPLSERLRPKTYATPKPKEIVLKLQDRLPQERS